MIVAQRKPMDEIRGFLDRYSRVLVLGCGGCVTVCNAGGEREVGTLVSVLKLSGISEVEQGTIERQCDAEFFEEIRALGESCEAILSMACGAGVQMAARIFPDKPVFPGLNTQGMALNEGAGEWTEACLGCGDCKLGIFGGVCPMTQCSKSLCNGPCGGSENGKCEVDPETVECGWQKIYDRLARIGRLDVLETVEEPRDWSKTHDGRPRHIIRQDLAEEGFSSNE
ncbi:MAG: hypothetical protein HN742_40730 [Lentisphaerae bacterium]|jgi:hypothetical protein|nr:hypothetical protein [Lentisphaerota bacterium]MBT4818796.1 hypothetical protein [Lentisphaerota bacterium]MBT5606294.1 hypothetical protein [Lentisphaerota bacterium]MBT7059366.1 hypothetical protein [Lentisphaerota bacterium]MBT7848261.1 hypothetical protein [Lentisphaerota bacterium]